MSIPWKLRSGLFGLCLFATASTFAGSNLTIVQKTGAEKLVTASTLRSITFLGTNLNLNYQDGRLETVALPDIRKIFFSSLPDALKPLEKTSLQAFPNPVTETLFLKDLPQGATTVAVWHVSGRKVLQAEINASNASINVSSLEDGVYLLKTQNQTLRFIKR